MVYFYLLLHLATVGVYKGGNDPGNPKMSDTTRIASFGPLVSFFFFFFVRVLTDCPPHHRLRVLRTKQWQGASEGGERCQRQGFETR